MAENARESWEELWSQLDASAQAEKFSESASFELSSAYQRLPAEDREVVDEVLAEWVASDNETKRFDALALIRAHGIRSALPALQKLASRLASTNSPGAPHELEKVQCIIEQLAA